MRFKSFLLADLLTLSASAAIYEGLLYWHGIQVWPFVFQILLVAWVDADSRDYPQIDRLFEYGYLVFLFWLPYLQYNLWRTRGNKLGGFIVASGDYRSWLRFAVPQDPNSVGTNYRALHL